MIGKIVLAALVAGMLAGLVLAGIQHVRITPLIAQGEVFEKAAEGAVPCVENMLGMTMCSEDGASAWQPADGWQRTLSTTVASVIAGGGFAILLAGISLLIGAPITRANGFVWGLCGFLCVAVAPAAGLAPEVPGMPVADLLARQIWWVGTIVATGAGIYLVALRHEAWAKFVAVALIAAPHIIGAPLAPSGQTLVPPALAAQFASNSIAAAAVFWCLIGLFIGIAFERFNLQVQND